MAHTRKVSRIGPKDVGKTVKSIDSPWQLESLLNAVVPRLRSQILLEVCLLTVVDRPKHLANSRAFSFSGSFYPWPRYSSKWKISHEVCSPRVMGFYALFGQQTCPQNIPSPCSFISSGVCCIDVLSKIYSGQQENCWSCWKRKHKTQLTRLQSVWVVLRNRPVISLRT